MRKVSLATQMYEAGFDEQLMQERTGHRSLAVRRYKRTSAEQQKCVSEFLLSSSKVHRPASTTTLDAIQGSSLSLSSPEESYQSFTLPVSSAFPSFPSKSDTNSSSQPSDDENKSMSQGLGSASFTNCSITFSFHK